MLDQPGPRLLIATEKVRRFGLGNNCALESATVCLPFLHIYRRCFKSTESTPLSINITHYYGPQLGYVYSYLTSPPPPPFPPQIIELTSNDPPHFYFDIKRKEKEIATLNQ